MTEIFFARPQYTKQLYNVAQLYLIHENVIPQYTPTVPLNKSTLTLESLSMHHIRKKII